MYDEIIYQLESDIKSKFWFKIPNAVDKKIERKLSKKITKFFFDEKANVLTEFEAILNEELNPRYNITPF